MRIGSFLCGMALGSLAMYILDPAEGRRRRALARDKMNRIKNDMASYSGKTARDLRNRAQGVVAEASRPLH